MDMYITSLDEPKTVGPESLFFAEETLTQGCLATGIRRYCKDGTTASKNYHRIAQFFPRRAVPATYYYLWVPPIANKYERVFQISCWYKTARLNVLYYEESLKNWTRAVKAHDILIALSVSLRARPYFCRRKLRD